MSATHSFNSLQSRQSWRLIACLLLLLLSPLIEQAHVDDCENTACAVCSTLTSNELPAAEPYRPIALQASGAIRPLAPQLSNQIFCRHYDSRAPPHFS